MSHQSIKSRTAVVIGAGLAGLAAAYRLRKAGWSVRVLERNNHPGGCIGTVHERGYLIDTGPDMFTGGYKEFISLVQDVGLGDRIVTSSKVIGLVRDGVVHDIDTAKPLKALFTPTLSWPAKLGLAKGLWKLRKSLADIDGFRLFDKADLDDHNNARDWSIRYFGREIADYLIDPITRATVTTGAEHSSWLRAIGTLAGGSDPMLNLLGGLEVLPAAIAKDLSITYGATVTRVTAANADDGARISFIDAQGGQQQWTADACVISAMYHDMVDIYPELHDVANGFGTEIEDVNFISIQLGFDVLSHSRAHVIQVPGKEHADLIAIFQDHHKAPDRAPRGHSLLNLYTDTRSYASLAGKSDEEMISWALGEIQRWFPELRSKNLEVRHVGRWPQSGYIATPGSIRRTRDMINGLPVIPGVFLAGNLFGGGSNMEGAVISGNAAANRILAL